MTLWAGRGVGHYLYGSLTGLPATVITKRLTKRLKQSATVKYIGNFRQRLKCALELKHMLLKSEEKLSIIAS